MLIPSGSYSLMMLLCQIPVFIAGQEFQAGESGIDPQIISFTEQPCEGALVIIYFHPDDPVIMFWLTAPVKR